MTNRSKNMMMLAGVILMAALPLLLVNGDFGGADDAAEKLITELHPTYKPWFAPLVELPSETESMLFALQAAIGAGVIGYVIGWFKGKSSSKSNPL